MAAGGPCGSGLTPGGGGGAGGGGGGDAIKPSLGNLSSAEDVQEIQIEIPMEYINKWNKNNNAAAATASSHVWSDNDYDRDADADEEMEEEENDADADDDNDSIRRTAKSCASIE